MIKGNELACIEGCVNNSLNNLQIFDLDYQGKGGWTLVVGKGFDEDTIDGLSGPVLLVGPCAVEEVGETLIERLGQNKVHQSKECNDLAAIVEAMCHLMEVSPSRLDPGLDPIQAATVYQQAIENGTRARMIDGSCDVHKLR